MRPHICLPDLKLKVVELITVGIVYNQPMFLSTCAYMNECVQVCFQCLEVQIHPDENMGVIFPSRSHPPKATHTHTQLMLIRIRFHVLWNVCVYANMSLVLGELQKLVSHLFTHDDFRSQRRQNTIHSHSGHEIILVTELLINDILAGQRYDGDDYLGIFPPFWCNFHNNRDNRFATTETSSFNSQAKAAY